MARLFHLSLMVCSRVEGKQFVFSVKLVVLPVSLLLRWTLQAHTFLTFFQWVSKPNLIIFFKYLALCKHSVWLLNHIL